MKYKIFYTCLEEEVKKFQTEYDSIRSVVHDNIPNLVLLDIQLIKDVDDLHRKLDWEKNSLQDDQQLIVHLAGHGNRFGYELKGGYKDSQDNEVIRAEAAYKYFQSLGDKIDFIIFSSCKSIEIAEHVYEVKGLKGTIGLNSRLGDDLCSSFSNHFYQKFLESFNFEKALQHAKNGKILAEKEHEFFGKTKSAKNDGSTIGYNFTNNLREIGIDLNSSSEVLLNELNDSWNNKNHLDQKFLYLQPMSAKHWKSMISNYEYNIYDDCVSALKRTLRTKTWKTKIEEGSITSIVDLGVGTGAKDSLILKSYLKLNKKTKKLRYVIMDTSFPMLEITISALNELLLENKDKIEFRSLKSDFMKLGSHTIGTIRPKTGNVAFFSLGCTFSNVRENAFLESLSKVIRKGDLFIIGVELFDKSNKEESLEEAKNSYNTDSLKKLASISVRMVQEEARADPNEIKIDIDSGLQFSDIQNSSSVVIRFMDRVVAASSRYEEQYLISHIESLGYETKQIIVSGENKLYKHFIFEYNQ